METRHRLKLTFGQNFTHYFPVILVLLPCVLLIFYISQDLFGSYNGAEKIEKLYLPVTIFLCIAILFCILQYRRLYFKKIDIEYTDEQFKEAVKRAAEEMDWRIDNNRKDFFRASTVDFFFWGEMITIIKRKKYILINCICSPDKYSAITSFGKAKKHISVFLQNLNNVINGVAYVPKVEIVENEWSFKRMVFRIIIYPICILFIVAGVMMIYYHITLRNALAGVGLIALAIVILYADIKLWLGYKREEDNQIMN